MDWSEEKPTIELVKATVLVTDVLDMLAIEVNSGGKFASPFNPDERTWSAHDYGDHWHDFSTGKGGDVIDLVRAYCPELGLSKILWRIWTKALRAGKEPGDVEKQPVRQLMDFTEELSKYPRPDPWVNGQDWSYLNPPADCRIGEWCELLIPHADQDGVYGVKVRDVLNAKSAWPGSQFGKRLYDPNGWTGWSVDRPSRRVVVCEGESDCWAISGALGLSVIVLALPSGAGTWKDHWLEDLAPFDKVYICMDNDRAGQQARDKLTSKIGYLKAYQLRVPPLHNDVREAIAAGWRPSLP